MSIHRFFKQDDDSFFHSSSYAKVAHGEQLGATSAQSFTERHHIDRNRKMVKRYHDSIVARHSNRTLNSQKIDIVRPSGRASEVPPQPSRQETNATSSTRPVAPAPRPQTFRELPTRGYNPYS